MVNKIARVPASTDRILLRVVAFVALYGYAMVSVSAPLIKISGHVAPNSNTLTTDYSSFTEDSVIIPLNPPQEFDGLTKDEVYAKRIAQVRKYPGIINQNYTPYSAIFSWIIDGRPWWGEVGDFRFKFSLPRPYDAAEGHTLRSYPIINPLLLVDISCGAYHDYPIPTEKLNFSSQDFPFDCLQKDLKFSPKAHRAEVTVAATEYIAKLEQLGINILTPKTLTLGMVFINANDLGFRYVGIDAEQSPSVGKPTYFSYKTYPLRQYYAVGASCQISGGCNNENPVTGEWGNFYVNVFPSQLVFKLWKEKPKSARDKEDFLYTVHFK